MRLLPKGEHKESRMASASFCVLAFALLPCVGRDTPKELTTHSKRVRAVPCLRNRGRCTVFKEVLQTRVHPD